MSPLHTFQKKCGPAACGLKNSIYVNYLPGTVMPRCDFSAEQVRRLFFRITDDAELVSVEKGKNFIHILKCQKISVVSRVVTLDDQWLTFPISDKKLAWLVRPQNGS